MTEVPSLHTPGPAGTSRRGFLRPPSTRAGRQALILFAVAVALFVCANIVVSTGQEGGDTIFDNPWISVPMLGAGASVLSAGAFATFAVVRRRERSLPVIAAMLFGLLVLAFLVGEFSTPH